ncbi:MogA/MoaB family molybdenum cofactor biosynthesis protein [Natronobeatus ordinarius]|uniref:MogA/MoaB family molybdenum cofactor biosynthesis protein n=1 Tax=Natronobeatus ordinarius TaxID=2963433 RepID=UPI0020CF6ED8|nr:molybdenum cofactor synthesis domain-containing protein [Natronobeatus ordinarius]
MADQPTDDSGTVSAAVVTISSERSLEADPAGDAIADVFDAAGHDVVTRELIARNYDNVQSKVSRLVDRSDVDLVVTTGGTGVEPEDATLEAVRPLIDKELPAFLDLFHELSYMEIGTRMVSSRALAGVADGVPVFCLPNNADATTLASEAIIVPEATRLAALANGGEDDTEE